MVVVRRRHSQGLCRDAALVELAAITARPGARGQDAHADTMPEHREDPTRTRRASGAVRTLVGLLDDPAPGIYVVDPEYNGRGGGSRSDGHGSLLPHEQGGAGAEREIDRYLMQHNGGQECAQFLFLPPQYNPNGVLKA